METRHGYVVTAAAFCLQMLGIGSLLSFGIFIPALENEFDWSRATLAGAASMANLVNGVLALGAGYFSDRYGPRIVMTAAGIIVGSAYLLISQTQAIWQLYLFYGGLFAIGWSAFDVVPLSTVAKRFSANRGVMTGIVKGGAGAGMISVMGIASIVGRLTTGKLIDRIGLRRTMTIGLVGWVLAYTWLQLQGGIWTS